MKLQVGEYYRLRNGEIVGPLLEKWFSSIYRFETELKSNAYSWTEGGRWCGEADNERDIIEHIPKEKEMKDKTTIRGLEIEF